MKILFDKNNLLTIENPNIPKAKEYCYDADGYEFCDYDRWIVVYHKSKFRIIHLKDLWDKMWVIMIKKGGSNIESFDLESMENALKIFEWFDENTWEKYCFLYKFSLNEVWKLNDKLKKLWSKIEFKKTEKWICCDYVEKKDNYDYASFLFWLTLVYGNFDIRNWELKSIKIQIPLFWAYLEYENELEKIKEFFANKWVFIRTNKQENQNWIVHQLTINDYELLWIFASFYDTIEKSLEISKYNEVLKIKEDLLEFVRNNQEIPTDWKDEVLKKIKNWMIKILIKN